MPHLLKLLAIIWLGIVGLLLVACSNSRPSPQPHKSTEVCSEGICVAVQLSEVPCRNRPVTATITVETEQDLPGLNITLSEKDPSTNPEGTRTWQVDSAAHHPLTFSAVFFAHDDRFNIMGRAGPSASHRFVGYSLAHSPGDCAEAPAMSMPLE